MMKKLLGAAAMAAMVFAVAPASAARMQGCSGPNLASTETAIEAMADGDAKWVAYKEMAAASTAVSEGKMAACAMHLNKAAHAGMMK